MKTDKFNVIQFSHGQTIWPDDGNQPNHALATLLRRSIGIKRPLSLSLSKDFDSRWIGELPIVFDGSPAQCVEYAQSKGYKWIEDDAALLGGRFEHPTEPDTLYPL